MINRMPTFFLRRLRTVFVVLVIMLLAACSTQQAPKESQSQALMRNQLSTLGISMCGGPSVTTSSGDGVSEDFELLYRRTWKCTNDAYWYHYVHRANGTSLSWSTDIDRLNNSLRRLHESNKIKKIVSGPNHTAEDNERQHEDLPSYLDARYAPGAIRPETKTTQMDVISVVGTVWDVVSPPDKIAAFFFDEDGAIRIYDEKGLHTNATWMQQGGTIFIEMNDHYVEHYGVVTGITMTGNSWNATGERWSWTARKRSTAD